MTRGEKYLTAAVLGAAVVLAPGTPTDSDIVKLLPPRKIAMDPETGEIIGQRIMMDPATARIMHVEWMKPIKNDPAPECKNGVKFVSRVIGYSPNCR